MSASNFCYELLENKGYQFRHGTAFHQRKGRNTITGINMKKDKWREIITQACMDAKTYKPYFNSVIDTLAQILESRDAVHEQFVKEGGNYTIIKHTDRSNQENTYKNPLLVMEYDLNTQALKFWSELGLTSRSLKAIQNGLKDDEGSSIEDLLSTLENG